MATGALKRSEGDISGAQPVAMLSEVIEHHVQEEEKRVEGMFSQAR